MVGLEAHGALVWTARCCDDVAGSLESAENTVQMWTETDIWNAGSE